MIDLTTWNLTIATGVPAVTIDTPLLAGGYQDDYFKSDSGQIFFWAPVDGTTTSNAIYPRSELRETHANGDLRNWTYPQADNYLSATLKVTQVPSTGKVVIGQIHSYKSTWPLLKLQFEMQSSGLAKLTAKIRNKPTDELSVSQTLLTNVPINQSFTYVVHLSPTGAMSIAFNGVKIFTRLDSAWAIKPLYFKAGAYTQDNTGYVSEAGAAIFSKLKIEHRALAPVSPP
ncbi:MAG: polysaccharide lyase family 7 protein [Pseudomonas sp.]|uniref:polysaccharide lyase family 7 protein n=1 Tax=Pseudomonas sp. TaxID=306 RepID=UPI0027324643|nr:polysaccharide lyase family 7 protein [Pseudomonas sp.]MDP3845012.1 polysaccharide lyase family 7 protein [Pseudomonas sp.]